jgi:pyridoxine/pyridoxamine 5'-phosphate oxidase
MNIPEGSTVPMPENWGGFAIQPMSFEFWQGREGRLHDRIVYVLEGSNGRSLGCNLNIEIKKALRRGLLCI